MSVGLVYRSTSISLPTSLDFVSRTTCSSLDTSTVNLMEDESYLLLAGKSLGFHDNVSISCPHRQ